jgi:hypothetical protein
VILGIDRQKSHVINSGIFTSAGRNIMEYTGTHGYLRYPDANNNPAPIFLYTANGKQVQALTNNHVNVSKLTLSQHYIVIYLLNIQCHGILVHLFFSIKDPLLGA